MRSGRGKRPVQWSGYALDPVSPALWKRHVDKTMLDVCVYAVRESTVREGQGEGQGERQREKEREREREKERKRDREREGQHGSS